jgi:uncharacterized OB-fold protein
VADVTGTDRPLPLHATPHATAGELRVQRCTACGAVPEFPRIACPRCLGELEWIRASGEGRVVSFAVVRRTHHVRFEPYVPILLAVVELPEGAQIVSTVVGDDRLDTTIDARVTVAEDGVWSTLPQFRLVRPGDA